MSRVSFAVIVTNYNYRAFVLDAIEGALAQTRAPQQVIVVDDGSTDGSPELLRERYGADPRVSLLLGENGGQLAAFRRGLEAARSDIVCFLDADDHWRPGYLAAIGEVFDARRDVDFLFSDVELFGDENRLMRYAERPLDLGYTIVSTYMLMHWYGAPTSALALRMPWAHRTLALPADLAAQWRISADNCLVFGASVLGARKYFLPTGCVRYRIHGNNGWWGRQSAGSAFLNRLRSRCLIRYYGQSMHLDERCVEDTKHEFLTKPDPTWREAWRYAKLARMRPMSWRRGWSRALSILWLTLLHKRRAPPG